ncbi:ChrR family anti-sigma-E factor [Alsobacter sp. KACC 23698]|uniref:ChrR family anti-sigma-E factor n=1 Tax=Alsobacter sp. KACC 23698 TaxID=3149229 RepID=A0AAU7J997_9HYPH
MIPNDEAAPNGSRLDELLAGYAAGTLSPHLHSLVAAHLYLKPESRSFVRAMEQIGAQALEDMPACAVADRDRKLAAIFESAERVEPRPAAPVCSVMPPPLCAVAGKRVSDIPWRFKLPGVREFRLPDQAGTEATLYWIKPGKTIPSHTHEGSEVTLVLRGGFSDTTGHYMRGDIAIADPEIDHHPRADEGEDCICFAVTDAPLRLTGPLARFVRRIVGH